MRQAVPQGKSSKEAGARAGRPPACPNPGPQAAGAEVVVVWGMGGARAPSLLQAEATTLSGTWQSEPLVQPPGWQGNGTFGDPGH